MNHWEALRIPEFTAFVFQVLRIWGLYLKKLYSYSIAFFLEKKREAEISIGPGTVDITTAEMSSI